MSPRHARIRFGFLSAMVDIVSTFRKMSTKSDQAHFHDLRHTVVTRLLEAGEPNTLVESRMLEHYSHIRLSAKKAALNRLGESEKPGRIKATK